MKGASNHETNSVVSDSTRGSRTTTGSSSGGIGKVMVSAEVTVAPLQQCLRQHKLGAKVIDVDHYQKGLVAVGTDYIIEIKSLQLSNSEEGPSFNYMISKSYHQFRKLCSKLKDSSELATKSVKTARDFSKSAKFVVKFTDSVCKIIDSEPVEYFAKVSYTYVKKLSEERLRRINDALDFITKNFPSLDDDDMHSDPSVKKMVHNIEKFFLTDHVVEEGKELPDYLKPEKHHSKSKIKKHQANVQSSPSPTSHKPPTTKNVSTGPSSTTSKDQLTPESKVLTPNTKTSGNNDDRPPPLSSISMKTRRSLVLRQADSAKLQKLGSTRSGLTIEETDVTSRAGQRLGMSRGQRLDGGTSQQDAASRSWLPGMIVTVPTLAALLIFLKRAQYSSLHIDADYAALICFVCFSFGVQFNKITSTGSNDNSKLDQSKSGVAVSPLDISKSGRGVSDAGVTFTQSVELKVENKSQASSLALLRKSMSSRKSLSSPTSTRFLALSSELDAELDESSRQQPIIEEEEHENNTVLLETENGIDETHDDDNDHSSAPRALIQSPLRAFPQNGNPETDLNCVSEAPHDTFPVRGPKYLVDHKKIPSKEMLFPCRGADLLLTDECPENVGRSSAILGGQLRDKPTFLINFRLPWGVLIFYYEIPQKFLPFVQKCYDPSWQGKSVPSIDNFSPSEKCVARFLMGSDEQKKESLKILPKVVIGPWMVKSVVGTKPAIIGNKLPVNYVYGPPDPHHNKALYLEADLDIVASSAARKILGVVRSYTQTLTIDLGFLIEGKQFDELPEQMLVGTRIHGLDPLNASLLPPLPNDIGEENGSDDASLDSSGTNR